jgi:hypothetical protein
MRHLILGILRKPTERVTEPRDQKQQDEGEPERVLVQPQDPAAASDGPGRVRIVGEIPRISVDEFLDSRTPGFRGSLLNQERRQYVRRGETTDDVDGGVGAAQMIATIGDQRLALLIRRPRAPRGPCQVRG